tara:strand:- start:3769 stop:4620 length:852 start_codon:yes stop_codon:yes gene_type:complete
MQKLLSICIPVYNRYDYLKKLLDSIDLNFKNEIEIIISDDGSTDNIVKLINEYQKIYSIKYIKQLNSGRGLAIFKAINQAQGIYTILMDSDDYFLDESFDMIINLIMKKRFNSYAFTTISKNKKIIIPDDILTNFVELRADYKVKGDLKEIVKTDILKNSINNNVDIKFRRFPTMLLWADIAEKYESLTVNKPIVFKNYLAGGLTKNIFYNKIKYSLPMVNLYKLLIKSKRYKSKIFRLKSIIFYYRYQFHACGLNDFDIKLFSFLGFLLYLIDKIYFKIKFK